MTVLRLPWSAVPAPDDPGFQEALQANFDRVALEWNNAAEKTVRGIVALDGTISAGSGFSVTKNGTGDYTITFDPAFAAVPSCVAINGDNSSGAFNHVTGSAAAASVRLQARVASTGVLTDMSFHFIAVGPR